MNEHGQSQPEYQQQVPPSTTIQIDTEMGQQSSSRRQPEPTSLGTRLWDALSRTNALNQEHTPRSTQISVPQFPSTSHSSPPTGFPPSGQHNPFIPQPQVSVSFGLTASPTTNSINYAASFNRSPSLPLQRESSLPDLQNVVRSFLGSASSAITAEQGPPTTDDRLNLVTSDGGGGHGGGGAGAGANGAANNEEENQRNAGTFSETMAQHPELRTFLMSATKLLPFVAIILLKAAYDHLNSLLNLVFLCGVFLHTNTHLKREIGKKLQRNDKKLYLHLLVIAFALLLKFNDDPYILDIMSMLSYTRITKLGDLLYFLIMADLCTKCVTVAAKTVLALMPERVVQFKGRGRIYLFIESISQFYRCFLPVQPWVAFLLNNYDGYDKIFGSILVAIYALWKFNEVVGSGIFLRQSYIKFKHNSNFGVTPSNEELVMAGGSCPICHETFSSPIRLMCNHVFCDQCIGVWFDRETTCPLCRQKMVGDVTWRDGSTSLFVQFF